MEIGGLALGGVTLIFAVLAWHAALRSNRLATERAHVRWEVYPDGPGTFEVVNVGTDSAYKVSAEMWDAHDHVTEQATLVEPTHGLRFTMPTRARIGPDPTGVPEQVAPEPPVPAALPAPLRDTFELRRRMWEQTALQRAEMVREAERNQVAVRVDWRTKRGRWATWEGTTG